MDEPYQKEEELTVPDGLLANLERDFKEAMNALGGEESLGHFRSEYEKLYRALKKSHESEKQLVEHCQQMTQELLSNAAKMQAAVKLSQGDHSTIEALKKEIEKAWKTVDSANDSDFRARETVKTLKHEIATLQNMIDEGSAFSSDHTTTLEELKLSNKRVQVENEEMTKQIETLSAEMGEFASGTQKGEVDIVAHEEDLERVSARYDLVSQEHKRENNARERAEHQCKELLLLLRMRENELNAAQSREEGLQARVDGFNTQTRDATDRRQTLMQKLEVAERQLYHAQQSCNDSVDTTADLNERMQEMERQIAKTERTIVEQRAEGERVQRVRDSDWKEVSRMRQYIENIRSQKEGIDRQRDQVLRRIQALRDERAKLLQASNIVERERGALERKGEAELERKAAVERLLENESETQAELEDSIARESEIRARINGQIAAVEKEREECVADLSQVNVQHSGAEEELKMATLTVEETQKKIDESQATLNAQQAKYEQIRAERNQFSHKLVETQDEIVELKQKFKMMDHQLLQFKEELHMKEKKHQEETARQKSAKERLTKARKTVNEHSAAFDEAKVKSETLGQQMKQLVKVIDVCDKQLSAQQQDFLKISAERDLLGTQLVRRNDELALLYEKLRVQQETLGRGETAYQSRLEDLRLLRLKTEEVSRQARLANTHVNDMQVAKVRVKILEQEISIERAKAKALSEELENPNNTMRWRKMGGADPTAEELEKKQTHLQKLLISKSEECLEQEMTLQERSRLVAEMHTLLARQPGPEVALQLNVYNKELQKKNARMKQKASELNMTSTHISELKYEAERLRRELHDVKRKYYEVKVNNDQFLRDELAGTAPIVYSDSVI